MCLLIIRILESSTHTFGLVCEEEGTSASTQSAAKQNVPFSSSFLPFVPAAPCLECLPFEGYSDSFMFFFPGANPWDNGGRALVDLVIQTGSRNREGVSMRPGPPAGLPPPCPVPRRAENKWLHFICGLTRVRRSSTEFIEHLLCECTKQAVGVLVGT